MSKMKFLSLPICLILIACGASSESSAQQSGKNSPTIEKTELTKSEESRGLFKGSRVDQMIDLNKELTDAMSLIYIRSSPGIKDQIKPAVMPPEGRDVYSCVVKKTRAQGLTKQLDESFTYSKDLMEYIRKTKTLKMQDLETNAKFKDLVEKTAAPEFQALNTISKECGVMAISLKLSSSTGALKAMMNASK